MLYYKHWGWKKKNPKPKEMELFPWGTDKQKET